MAFLEEKLISLLCVHTHTHTHCNKVKICSNPDQFIFSSIIWPSSSRRRPCRHLIIMTRSTRCLDDDHHDHRIIRHRWSWSHTPLLPPPLSYHHPSSQTTAFLPCVLCACSFHNGIIIIATTVIYCIMGKMECASIAKSYNTIKWRGTRWLFGKRNQEKNRKKKERSKKEKGEKRKNFSGKKICVAKRPPPFTSAHTIFKSKCVCATDMDYKTSWELTQSPPPSSPPTPPYLMWIQ